MCLYLLLPHRDPSVLLEVVHCKKKTETFVFTAHVNLLFFIKIYTQDKGYLHHFLVTERDYMYTGASDCTTDNELFIHLYISWTRKWHFLHQNLNPNLLRLPNVSSLDIFVPSTAKEHLHLYDHGHVWVNFSIISNISFLMMFPNPLNFSPTIFTKFC